jgi:hypothetical protein
MYMVKRALVILILVGFPLAVQADSSVSVVDPSVSLGAAAAELGPSDNASGTASYTGDSSSLQPAGSTPLQSSAGASTGLTAPDLSDLQQSGSTSQANLQVVLGDADGPTHQPGSGSTSYWGWLWFTLIFALLVISLAVVLQKPAHALARRFRRRGKAAHKA